MVLKRYEIRWIYHRCFYEGGDQMEYLPFDTQKEAEDYIKQHQDTCKSDSECECGIYRVELHSDYDVPTLIKKL